MVKVAEGIELYHSPLLRQQSVVIVTIGNVSRDQYWRFLLIKSKPRHLWYVKYLGGGVDLKMLSLDTLVTLRKVLEAA